MWSAEVQLPGGLDIAKQFFVQMKRVTEDKTSHH